MSTHEVTAERPDSVPQATQHLEAPLEGPGLPAERHDLPDATTGREF